MRELAVSFYDCFSPVRFGGGQAAIVPDAGDLDAEEMQRIARDLGLPATCFIQECDGGNVHVRFFSTVGEYHMCGHAAIGLFTYLAETGAIDPAAGAPAACTLVTPGARARVRVTDENGRPRVMLALDPPGFAPAGIDIDHLLACLGLTATGLHPRLPMERSLADFRHLVVPVASLEELASIAPDFAAVKEFCLANDLDSIAALTPDGTRADYRCREFCPAVGVDESPAAGTTNSALGVYLHRHDALGGRSTIVAHQGVELGRPSEIHVELAMHDGTVGHVSVGGYATRSLEGRLALPGP